MIEIGKIVTLRGDLFRTWRGRAAAEKTGVDRRLKNRI
jgi:hypothetical protein